MQKDIPASIAILFLLGLLGGWVFLQSPEQITQFFNELEFYAERNGEFLYVLVCSTVLSSVWVFSVLNRLFTVRKQGKRLRVIAGELAADWRKESKVRPIYLLVGLLGGVSGYFVLLNGLIWQTWYPRFFPVEWFWPISVGVGGNFGFSLFVLASFFGNLGLWGSLKKKYGSLPPMPQPKNGVVLGTINEDSDEHSPTWVQMCQRALHTNILVTGSPGTGKTVTTIYTLFEQFLTNFTVVPSVLAIDAKGRIFEELVRIIKEKGMEDRLVHMTIGGDVKYNPIFRKNALKDGKFSDTAQLLKAATANFNGAAKSAESSFWESQGYYLMRNALIYCAAVQSYYTMRDLYAVILRASDCDLGAELTDVLKEGDFDEEERYNIECAIRYFGSEFENLESKIRTSIVATSTNFLNQFQEYQAARIFCPKENEQSLPEIDELVDSGKFLLFDIANSKIANPMGVIIKLQYQESIMNRLTKADRMKDKRPVLFLIDEYHSVASVGGKGNMGDDRFLSQGREPGAIFIAATQALSSIHNAILNKDAANELIQCFRTRIAFYSSDLMTIENFQKLIGRKDIKKKSHSISEYAQHASRNLVSGGFDARDANISESVSTSEDKDFEVTGREFSQLKTFEAWALIFDGVETTLRKLFLKPHFLENKREPHAKILDRLRIASIVLLLWGSATLNAFPNFCTAAKSSSFKSCMDFSVGLCMCGFPPRPCAKFDYYIPKTFVEVVPDAGSSYFGFFPGTAIQLQSIKKYPFGAEADENSQSFHAHTIAVPLGMYWLSTLPCQGGRMDKFCFDGMSEHVSEHWKTGSGDLLQPKFLAWGLSPKACMIKGAVSSATGYGGSPAFGMAPSCSFPMEFIPRFPPSPYPACTGWGPFFPRYGTYNGPSHAVGALMIAARMRSLSQEVFQTTPGSFDEKWQMLEPQASSCFRFGQNAGLLEHIKQVKELKRLAGGKKKGFLFVTWEKVSCCKDLALVPEAYIAIEVMHAVCKAVGG